MGGREGWSEEQGLPGLKGRAIQPQAAYIRQPQVRVSRDHVQHAAGQLLFIDVEVCHGVNGCEDDVCPLRRLEVFCKGLWEEGREGAKTCHTECPDGAA